MKILPITYKGKTYCVIVSNEDWRKVKKLSWHISQSAGSGKRVGQPYARTTIGKKKIYLHRYIMGADDVTLHVDHLNHQTLDCRRENLEVVTLEENMRRRRLRAKKKPNVKGQTEISLVTPPEPPKRNLSDLLRP